MFYLSIDENGIARLNCPPQPDLKFIQGLVRGDHPDDEGLIQWLPASRFNLPRDLLVYCNDSGRLYGYTPTVQTLDGEQIAGRVAILGSRLDDGGDACEAPLDEEHASLYAARLAEWLLNPKG